MVLFNSGVEQHMEDSIDIETWANAFIEINLIEQEIDTDHPLWWAVERTFHALRRDHAEDLWDFVLFVLGRRPNERVLSCLAAGPLEDLIAYDGKYFIDRIELLVLHDPAFKHLIGGVWQNQTPPDIWNRIEQCRGTAW
ncbi:hypothetical protein MOU_14992 [Xanthomonas citri pv. malvacearum str. GSPB1386]|nr:hypothetical protein MOU_14992 [Xanthomonas citri pv. malvacearum str. GSPB1386]